MDEQIFMRAAEAALPALHRVAVGILRSRADAEDAVQQGLMKAWAAREKANPEKLRPWISRIVINECRNIQRYRMRVSPSADICPEVPFHAPDRDVMDAVQALPEGVRIPFLLKYAAAYSEKEIVQALRLPQSTVKHRLARAKQLLRRELADTEVTFDE